MLLKALSYADILILLFGVLYSTVLFEFNARSERIYRNIILILTLMG